MPHRHLFQPAPSMPSALQTCPAPQVFAQSHSDSTSGHCPRPMETPKAYNKERSGKCAGQRTRGSRCPKRARHDSTQGDSIPHLAPREARARTGWSAQIHPPWCNGNNSGPNPTCLARPKFCSTAGNCKSARPRTKVTVASNVAATGSTPDASGLRSCSTVSSPVPAHHCSGPWWCVWSHPWWARLRHRHRGSSSGPNPSSPERQIARNTSGTGRCCRPGNTGTPRRQAARNTADVPKVSTRLHLRRCGGRLEETPRPALCCRWRPTGRRRRPPPRRTTTQREPSQR